MSNVHITEKMSTSNKPQEKQGPNFMALLTVSKKSARTEAGILRLRQATYSKLQGILQGRNSLLVVQAKNAHGKRRVWRLAEP